MTYLLSEKFVNLQITENCAWPAKAPWSGMQRIDTSSTDITDGYSFIHILNAHAD